VEYLPLELDVPFYCAQGGIMSETAREISQEYWRPAQQANRTEYPVASVTPYCNMCGTQYATGARFCHVCGENREPEFQATGANRIAQALDFTTIRQKLGLTTTSLVLVAVAIGCVLGALLTGIVYSANTIAEFQAVQSWRMEWMLAALVALVAAILFKDGARTAE
jgi:hypothetical protein